MDKEPEATIKDEADKNKGKEKETTAKIGQNYDWDKLSATWQVCINSVAFVLSFCQW